MADDVQQSTGESQPDESLGARVGQLEAGQDSLAGKVDKILGIISGGGGQDGDGGGHGEEPTGGAPNIAHEIRAQLAERDRKSREDAEKKTLSDELAGVKARIAELAEKQPEPMPRRVEKFMGWR